MKNYLRSFSCERVLKIIINYLYQQGYFFFHFRKIMDECLSVIIEINRRKKENENYLCSSYSEQKLLKTYFLIICLAWIGSGSF